MTRDFQNSDIAIVARACVLPGARTPEEFWANARAGKSLAAEITTERLKPYLGHRHDSGSELISSRLACEISKEIHDGLIAKHGLQSEECNRLYAYTYEALDQIRKAVRSPLPAPERIDLVFGCMNPDSDYEIEVLRANQEVYRGDLKFWIGASNDEKKALIDEIIDFTVEDLREQTRQATDNYFTSRTVARLAEKFGFEGEQFLIDAACASSLVAIEAAMQRLKLGKADLVIAGGIESNLGYGSFAAFTAVGALAKDNSLPFDKRSQGIVQGEGSVLFALKRLGDALRDGDRIHAVIRGATGSSDGRSASLFQPNAEGQAVVYRSIYGDDRELSYLEAHGTGTEVGDRTEMESITGFFQGQRFPVGSSKYLVGHTKGAAGATGVLKSLFVIEEKFVPPSAYVTNPVFDKEERPFVNATPVELDETKPVRVGVNAFGFGGTNYHVLLEEFTPAAQVKPASLVSPGTQVVVGETTIDLDSFTNESFLENDFPFRLPPKALGSIDKVQLAALLGSWNCIRALGKPWGFIPKDKINVVSACTLFLDQIYGSSHRMAYEMFDVVAERDEKAELIRKDMHLHLANLISARYPKMNEDSATGVLNNVIAGRVCNAFDLYGKSYNVDKDLASGAVAWEAIVDDLRLKPDQLFVYIEVGERLDETGKKSIRDTVTVRLVTSAEFAVRHELAAQAEVQVRRIEDRETVATAGGWQ